MFHGGTNFGFGAGSNHNKGFAPTVTSYDYCAPLTEWGDYTETYHKIRKLLCEKQGLPLDELPPSPKMQNIGKVALTESVGLFESLDNIAQKHYSPLPRNMEAFDQDYGLIYYVTRLKGKYSASILTVKDVHDYAHIYFNKIKAVLFCDLYTFIHVFALNERRHSKLHFRLRYII
jgi:beta-galactosidase